MSVIQVKHAVGQLPLHPLLIIVQKMLTRANLGDVEVLDRWTARQRSRHGGSELECRFDIGVHNALVVVKVVQDSVHKRMLAELAGTVLARQATFGILIATKDASAQMLKHSALLRAAHVEIVDGTRLAELLIQYRIGVRPNGEPDYEYLYYIEEMAPQLLESIRRLRR